MVLFEQELTQFLFRKQRKLHLQLQRRSQRNIQDQHHQQKQQQREQMRKMQERVRESVWNQGQASRLCKVERGGSSAEKAERAEAAQAGGIKPQAEPAAEGEDGGRHNQPRAAHAEARYQGEQVPRHIFVV